jgi:WD40 repeat protein
MARIFLSHSSSNELEAVALKHWLADNGWGEEDVFLDVDPERGLVAGERWQDALRKAADCCEAVVFIISPAWAKSKWCLAEFLLAKNLHKHIFGIMLEEVPISELPIEMTSEWQLCQLVGNGPTETVRFQHREAVHEVSFLVDGLRRFRNGLKKAGLNADFFPWPPKDDPNRSPYRGLEPLDFRDAAVFFGRDVEILRGLDVLRGMRDSKDKKLFIILGASGTGKSSFLRAGLLPRLARDEHHFFPLPVVRPERKPVSGEKGLARALQRAHSELKLQTKIWAHIQNSLARGPAGLAQLLKELLDAASSRLFTSTDDTAVSTPTLILPVDQAEELFSIDASAEAREFLRLIGAILRGDSAVQQLPMIVAFTIRSDRYEPLQTAPELADLQSMVFDDLKPMPPNRFREVMLGPARRVIIGGNQLDIKPGLVNRLEEECCQGGDTLPLLSLILFRLYCDYGSDGSICLDEYIAMGGLKDVVKKEAESVLSTDEATRQQQLDRLHAAFIPWLATINPDNEQPMRRMAKLSSLPEESRSLILALADKRLLLTDQRQGQTIVEVAHEALLRQWDVLTGWLQAEREDLKNADILQCAMQAWEKNGRRAAWLLEGERLASAEALAAKPNFRQLLATCHEFLNASRLRENAMQEEERRRRQAELDAARRLAEEQQERANIEARRNKQLRIALFATVLLMLSAAYFGVSAHNAKQRALTKAREATVFKLSAQAQGMMAHKITGSDERAYLQLLAANRLRKDHEVDLALLHALIDSVDMQWIIEIPSAITSVAFNSDGTRIVSGGSDKTLRLWDAKTGKPDGQPWKGHNGMVTCVAFNQDGTRIISGDAEGTLYLWNAKTGKPIGLPLKGHLDWITSVAFSLDGTRIVSGSWDRTLRLWDAHTGQPIGHPLKGHLDRVSSVAFSPDSPDGSHIVSGSDDTTLRLWNTDTGKSDELKGHEKMVSSVAFSPDGTRIVSGSWDKTLRLWDAKSLQQIGPPLEGHEDGISSVAFSRDGSRIVSGSYDKILRLWDANTHKLVQSPLRGHEKGVTSVAFSPDGTRIVSGSWDRTLRLWGAHADQPIGIPLRPLELPDEHKIKITSAALEQDGIRLVSHNWGTRDAHASQPNGISQDLSEEHKIKVTSVVFSPDGTRLVSGSEDKALRLWDARTGQLIGSPLLGHEAEVTCIAFSPDGTRIVSGSGDKTLRLWDAKTGQPIGQPLKGHMGRVSSVAFSPDGSRIVSGSDDTTLCLWNAKIDEPVCESLEGHEEGVTSVAFSPGGTRIVSGSWDKTLRLWDANTSKPIGKPLRGHKDQVSSVAFSPDGARIVSGSEDKTLRLWDTQTGQPIGLPLKGHGKGVTSVAFNRDGTQIVSGSKFGWDTSDDTLRLWNAKTRKPVGPPLAGHTNQVSSVTFSPDPDSRLIVSGSWDGTIRLWPVPQIWAEELCKKLTRNMSRKEWQEWVSRDIDYVKQCCDLPPISSDAPKAIPVTARNECP